MIDNKQKFKDFKETIKNKYFCPICNSSFIFINDSYEFECDECHQTFLYESDLWKWRYKYWKRFIEIMTNLFLIIKGHEYVRY